MVTDDGPTGTDGDTARDGTAGADGATDGDAVDAGVAAAGGSECRISAGTAATPISTGTDDDVVEVEAGEPSSGFAMFCGLAPAPTSARPSWAFNDANSVAAADVGGSGTAAARAGAGGATEGWAAPTSDAPVSDANCARTRASPALSRAVTGAGQGRLMKSRRCIHTTSPAAASTTRVAAVPSSQRRRRGSTAATAAGVECCSPAGGGHGRVWTSSMTSSWGSVCGKGPRSPGRRTGDSRGMPARSRSGALVMWVSMIDLLAGGFLPAGCKAALRTPPASFSFLPRPTAPGRRRRRSRWP